MAETTKAGYKKIAVQSIGAAISLLLDACLDLDSAGEELMSSRVYDLSQEACAIRHKLRARKRTAKKPRK